VLAEIIPHPHAMPCAQQRLRQMKTDEASAAGDRRPLLDSSGEGSGEAKQSGRSRGQGRRQARDGSQQGHDDKSLPARAYSMETLSRPADLSRSSTINLVILGPQRG
jgi:hypothetical protein